MPTDTETLTPHRNGVPTDTTETGLAAYARQGAGLLWNGTQDAVRWTADRVEDGAAWTWHELRARPSFGGLLLGGLGLGASMVIGVGELAVGVAIGYAGYLVLARGEAPMQALRDAIALEHGEAGKRAKGRPETHVSGRGQTRA